MEKSKPAAHFRGLRYMVSFIANVVPQFYQERHALNYLKGMKAVLDKEISDREKARRRYD